MRTWGPRGPPRRKLVGEAVAWNPPCAAASGPPANKAARPPARRMYKATAEHRFQTEAEKHPDLGKNGPVPYCAQKPAPKNISTRNRRGGAKQPARSADKKRRSHAEKLRRKPALRQSVHPVGVVIALPCILLLFTSSPRLLLW